MNRLSLPAAMLACSLMGCGGSTGADNLPETVPATGYVKMSGKPVTGAQVVIAPLTGDGHAASALTDDNGYFELRAFDAKPGVVPGEYGMQVTKTVQETRDASGIVIPEEDQGHDAPGGGEVHWRNILPEKYANITTSGLVISVFEEEGNEGIEIDLL